MDSVFLQETIVPPDINSATQTLGGHWEILLIGIVLIVAAVLLFLFLKKIVVNSVLGLIAWAILIFVFKFELSFFPTLVISAIFGLAGIGVILVLNFLGVAI